MRRPKPFSRCTWPALAAVWMPLLLAGCGFHLQGRSELPRSLVSAHLEAQDAQSDFYTSLRASLLTAGARLDGTAADTATIYILDDSTSDRVLTVSARNIPTAFQLSYHIKISVESQGHELMAPEVHTVSREYSFDERALLSKEREREALAQALADDLAALVMRRLAAL